MTWATPPVRHHLALATAALCIAGYPLAATLVELTSLPHQWITYPLRGAVLALSLCVLGLWLRAPRINPSALALPVFLTLYLSRLLFDWKVADNPHAPWATMYFLSTVAAPSAAIMLGANGSFDQKAFRSWLLVLGLPVVIVAAILVFARPDITVLGRAQFLALNPISLAQISAVVFLCALSLASPSSGRLRSIAVTIVLVLAAFVMVQANSRGPLLALVASVAFLLTLEWRRAVYLIPVATCVAVFVMFPLNSPDEVAIAYGAPAGLKDRLETAFSAADPSVSTRLQLLADGWAAFARSPFVGSYFADPSKDVWSYPHNIIVETAMALGIGGLLALLWTTYLILRAAAGSWRTNELSIALLIQFGCVAMVSGVIWSSAELFAVISILLCSRVSEKRTIG